VLVARDSNSRTPFSLRCSFGIKVWPGGPGRVGSEINTPLPYLVTCHAATGFESYGLDDASITSAGFPWKTTRSPTCISSPDLYFERIVPRCIRAGPLRRPNGRRVTTTPTSGHDVRQTNPNNQIAVPSRSRLFFGENLFVDALEPLRHKEA
jgi:hypothetical protein